MCYRREISFDVVTDEPIHVDFLRMVAGRKFVLEIPVRFINNDQSPGLKRGEFKYCKKKS